MQKTIGVDHYRTPEYAIDILLPYIPKDKLIIETAPFHKNCEESAIIEVFKKHGYKTHCFGERKTFSFTGDNVILVTNPPYTNGGKEDYLNLGFHLDLAFAYLLPLTTLEGRERGDMFRQHDIQLIIPNRRVNFITPDGKGKGAWFPVAWFCYKLNLPKQLNFVDMQRR